MSQNRDISPPRAGASLQLIFTKFGEFTDVVTPVKIFNVCPVWKRIFPYIKSRLINIAMRYRAGLWSLQQSSDGAATPALYTQQTLLEITLNLRLIESIQR